MSSASVVSEQIAAAVFVQEAIWNPRLHDKIYNIIQQNNIFSNYIPYKKTIITKIISENKHLKKQKSTNINAYKKKIK